MASAPDNSHSRGALQYNDARDDFQSVLDELEESDEELSSLLAAVAGSAEEAPTPSAAASVDERAARCPTSG